MKLILELIGVTSFALLFVGVCDVLINKFCDWIFGER